MNMYRKRKRKHSPIKYSDISKKPIITNTPQIFQKSPLLFKENIQSERLSKIFQFHPPQKKTSILRRPGLSILSPQVFPKCPTFGLSRISSPRGKSSIVDDRQWPNRPCPLPGRFRCLRTRKKKIKTAWLKGVIRMNIYIYIYMFSIYRCCVFSKRVDSNIF